MTANLAPALKIEFKIGASHSEIMFWRGSEREPTVHVINPGFSKTNLSNLRAEVRDGLKAFRRMLQGDVDTKLKDALAALCRLHECGRSILIKLFGDDVVNKLPEASQLCQDVCSTDAGGWDWDTIQPRLIVTITSIEDGLPVDILPLLNPMKPKSQENYENLRDIAASFLGFAGIVKRDIGIGVPDSMHLENIPRLPIRIFVHRGLDGARREEVFLRGNDHIYAEPPWPAPNSPNPDFSKYRCIGAANQR